MDQSREAFDRLLPELPAQLDTTSKQLTITRPSGPIVICLTKPNRYHEAIFKALAAAIQTPWFTGISPTSQASYLRNFQQLFQWINDSEYNTTEKNCYKCLKKYEAYRINEAGVKRSPLAMLRTLLGHGFNAKGLSYEDYLYLRTLQRLSKPCKQPEPEPYTLGDWFNLPWLRSMMGERQYLSLESPSRLLISFRVTVATTLSYLLEIREQWTNRTDFSSKMNAKSCWYWHWDSQLLKHLGNFDSSGEPADELTELLCLDIVNQKQWPKLKELIANHGIERAGSQPSIKKQKIYAWALPVFFHPDYQRTYSEVEEYLMAWLVACETVQPSDIAKLKTTNYACEYNPAGRLVAMQCCYYKGRAGLHRESAMLLASDCWTKAQHAYIKRLPLADRLFRHSIGRTSETPGFSPKIRVTNTPINLIWKLWQTPRLQSRIRAALKRAGALPIFLEAALAITKGREDDKRIRRKNPSSPRSEYEAAVPRFLFSLTHIKTTAVHAGSDQYRDGDLINHHSHTSATEKHHYLTDANQDFVNRAGRITRLVLHDLQNVVFQPSVSVLTQAVNDLELRSRVAEATGIEDAQVHPLNLPTIGSNAGDMILIPDTTEQALIFTHWIAQAEERYQQLLNLRPDWVERTLLPQLEWMSRVLAKMRSAVAAQQQYEELKPHLPPIFDHLMETHE